MNMFFTMIMACSLYPDNSITNAIAQVGSGGKPLTVTSVAADGAVVTKDTFKNAMQAAAYAQTAIDRGEEVAIGLMQLPSQWLSRYEGRVTLEELFRSCKNMVIATQTLNAAAQQCRENGDDEPSCALSVYRTGDSKQGLGYAEAVLKYAAEYPIKNQAKNAVTHHQAPPPAPELPEPDFGGNEL
jgi:hypothetical protein